MHFLHAPLPDDDDKEIPDDALLKMGGDLDDEDDALADEDDDAEAVGFDRYDDIDEF